jgi:hypothetical protein
MRSAPGLSRVTPTLALSLLLALGLATTACGDGDDCAVGSEQSRTELFFGLDRENAAPISESEFQNFVDTSVTPRFKDGLTLFNANGQYLMDNGTLVHENSKVIVLLHDGSAAHSKDIDIIREEYKSRFNQESVLRIDSPSCVAF